MTATQPSRRNIGLVVELALNDFTDWRTMQRLREHFAEHDLATPEQLAMLDAGILKAQVDIAGREAHDNWRSTMIAGHKVRRGTKWFGPDGDQTSWMTWVVIERKPGTTYKLLHKIAVEAGIGFYRRYSGPGQAFSHEGGMRRLTNTRAIFTQHGGLDI